MIASISSLADLEFRSVTWRTSIGLAIDRRNECFLEPVNEITISDNCFAGIQYELFPNGAIKTNQCEFIKRLAGKIGVSHMAPVRNPVSVDFFDPSNTPDDIIPYDTKDYQSLTGSLIQIVKTRDDVRHLISHLCSKNSNPTTGDYTKAIQVSRYILSTCTLGRVYNSLTTDIHIYCDSAFAITENGLSTTAYTLSNGPDNAPFLSYAKAQNDVAPDPMTAEYIAAGSSIKQLAHFLQLADNLGFRQEGQVEVILDCQFAINLIVAPEITRKSRHTKSTHPYIREAKERNVIKIVLAPDMRCDVCTKIYVNSTLEKKRDNLLNSNAISIPKSTSRMTLVVYFNGRIHFNRRIHKSVKFN